MAATPGDRAYCNRIAVLVTPSAGGTRKAVSLSASQCPCGVLLVNCLLRDRQTRCDLLPNDALVARATHERRFTAAQEAAILRLTRQESTGMLAPGISLGAALQAARRHVRRHKMTRFYVARLERALDAPLVTLPYLFRDDLGLDDIRLLADRLEAA